MRLHPVDGLPLRCHHGSTSCWYCHYHRMQARLQARLRRTYTTARTK